MTKIGLLSDTHGYWDERYARYFSDCDQIWHAGDIGSMEVAERLGKICPLMAVYGNVDGGDLRQFYTEVLRFRCEGVEVMMKHIGGYPGHYDRSVVRSLTASPPDLFISGHSHILKVQYDNRLHLLHINPGAAGMQGWQKVRTLVRFEIEGKDIMNLEIIELNNAE